MVTVDSSGSGSDSKPPDNHQIAGIGSKQWLTESIQCSIHETQCKGRVENTQAQFLEKCGDDDVFSREGL